MKFRLQAFWLFLLTFVSVQLPQRPPCLLLLLLQQQGHCKQLSSVCCPTAWTRGVTQTMATIEVHKGNELENAMKLHKAAGQTSAVVGDITTTTTTDRETNRDADAETTSSADVATTLASKSIGMQVLKPAAGSKVRELRQSLNLNLNVAKLLANDAATTATITEAIQAHQPERRHVMLASPPEKLQYTKEIQVKQGRLMGIIRRFQVPSGLEQVDQYLGLPYAEAPTGSRRFMPPGAPLPWQGLKIARHLPPVCPQKLPDLSPQASGNMSRGRYKYFMRLLPYLKVESEDCLYLNLYVPHEEPLAAPKLFPVLVYLHGESFEWNSGNAYDGSVLASYGQVIVVTVNFRLGVLGFLRPGIDAHNIANYALLDQIAALHWVKENIGSFGGDNTRVTLMGHSTGAACVNYLMVSPVASGLFHRAILMSGSAMSDWAASNQTLQLTMQIAHALNCPLGGGFGGDDAQHDDEALLECLRQRRYEDILHIPTTLLPQFSTSLGPIVDGHVIPNQPYKVMGHYTEHFSRYDLLFGITESESYHTLAALALEEGLRENERDNLLRFYMQSRFDVRPDLALAATMKKYQDMYNNPIKASNLEHRDVVLDILSDARVVGPLLQTGLFHADVNRRNYMYVFGHNSATGPHSNLPHSIMGEELAFIFGAPLAPAGPFPSHNYSVQEKLLSEAVMAYWTNFVKTGNPKAPWKGIFLNSHALEWDRYDLDWPEFNKRGQAYLNIGIPPTVGYKYRQIYMNFWNKELPDELNQIAAIQEQQQQPFMRVPQAAHATANADAAQFPSPVTQRRAGSEVITGHMSKYGTRDNGAEDPVRTLKLLLQDPDLTAMGSPTSTAAAAENMYNAPPTFGTINSITNSRQPLPGEHQHQFHTLATPAEGEDHTPASGSGSTSTGGEPVAKSETTLQLLIALIAVFIVLNIVIYATFLLQKRRKRASSLQRKLGTGGGGMLSYDGATDDELKRTAHSKSHDGDDSYILDMVRKSNTYEAIKTAQRSPINGYAITRQLSSSTVDTHTKVCEWMLGHTLPKSHSPGSFATPQVSVAVDATPQARGSSVLQQEPIELSKLRGIDGRIIICQDIEVADAELLTPQHMHDDVFHYELLQRQHSALTEPSDAPLASQQQQLQYCHQHSRSDPVDIILCQQLQADEQITSFVHADDVDINVTSRDNEERLPALTAAQQLELLRQRNYPKVLPTSHGCGLQGGNESPPMTADLSRSYKRNSLPPQSFGSLLNAPLPPPRANSSTLGGRGQRRARRDSSNITTSPLMLAHDCGDDEEACEPEITQNTLIVGPIVPKSPAVKRNNEKTTSMSALNSSEQQSAVSGAEGVVTAKLSGSFQSFESMPPAHEATPPTATTAQRTERVYAIEASPATTAATTTARETTKADASTLQAPSVLAGPSGALYAQPIKSASKSSLIPRMLSATSSNGQQTSATAEGKQESVGLPQTRIPQLQLANREKDKLPTNGLSSAGEESSGSVVGATTCPTMAERTASTISSSSGSSSWCSSSASGSSTSASSSTGTVRTELQQSQQPSKSITTSI